MQTPQANFVNPAVRSDCRIIVGLPLLSSMHAEYGNQAFTFHQVLKKQPDNSYMFNGNEVMNRLARTNYLTAGVHANLFHLGFWIKKNYFTLSINEKADLFTTFSKDLFALVWRGNTQFEGKTADLGRLSASFTMRHEIAFGLARKYGEDAVWGIRAKVLFGSMNSSSPRSSVKLHTGQDSSDLTFYSDWKLNTLLPLTVGDSAGKINYTRYNGSERDMLFNFKNIGIAFDFGFIRYRDENITISGSLLDVGFIRWTGNTASFRQKGDYTYLGALSDTTTKNFAGHFLQILRDEFGISYERKSYVSFLNPFYYLGATYRLRENLNAGALLSGRINHFRLTSGMTLSINKAFQKNVALSISWSYLYRSINNFGAGIRLGRSPLQFYAVSDNVPGIFRPLDSKNINLRFGLQFTPFCSGKKTNADKDRRGKKIKNDCGCTWADEEETRRERYKKHPKN